MGYKKLFLFIAFFIASVSSLFAMDIQQEERIKKKAALIAYEHPFMLSAAFNSFLLIPQLFKKMPQTCRALFFNNFFMGSFFFNHFGHEYLTAKELAHRRKLNWSICNRYCKHTAKSSRLLSEVCPFK